MKRKEFKTEPLPFQGQKRNFVKHFREALKDFPSDATYASDKYWKLTNYL